MRLTIPALALLLLLPAPIRAQVIRGIVLEEGGTTPIAGATIELLAPDREVLATTVSNPIGWFTFEVKNEGYFLLRTSHEFYTAGRTDSVSVGRHETVTIMIRMARTPIPLAPLVVAARSRSPLQRFRMRMEQGRPGKFVKREFIERRIAQRPSQLVAMTLGVRVIRSDDPWGKNAIVLRGPGGACEANVYLDGLPVPKDIAFSIDDLTAADAIEGVEIYDALDQLPAEFPMREDLSCGVVAYWTRPQARGRFSWKQLGVFVAAAGALVLYAYARVR